MPIQCLFITFIQNISVSNANTRNIIKNKWIATYRGKRRNGAGEISSYESER